MAKKTKKRKWFIQVRGSYLPNSPAGWLTYIPFTAFLVATLYIGWHYSYDAGLAALYVFPNWVAAAVVMTWIAKRTS